MNNNILWKQIDGYPNYVINTDGIVFNTKRNKELKQCYRSGYKSVVLFRNGKSISCFVHRLLANAFIPNPDNKPFVDHIDGNKINNNLTNLRWATPLENVRNENTFPQMIKRVREVCSTKEFCEKMHVIHNDPIYKEKHKENLRRGWDLLKKKVICIETKQMWNSCNDLAAFLKVDFREASHYCLGKRIYKGDFIKKDNIVVKNPHFAYIKEGVVLKNIHEKIVKIIKVRCIETNCIFNTIKEIADIVGVTKNTITSYCRGERLCNKIVTFPNGSTIANPHFEYIKTMEVINE